MESVIISDFDGCIVQDKAIFINSIVSRIINKMNAIIPVVIVTARATEKSKVEALQLLKSADLSHIPVFFRDMKEYDHSPSGLISFKSDCIKSMSLLKRPIIGIGDNDTDDEAYRLARVNHVVRIQWDDQENRSDLTYVIHVRNNNLADVWIQIINYLERIGHYGLGAS